MKNLAIIAMSLLLVHCEPVVPQNSTINKQLILDNHEYEDIIGNVEVIPVQSGQVNVLENPVIALNKNDYLTLNFDLLSDQFENLSARLIHCNKDWNKSRLRDMEFLNQINNFRITEFDYSVNTVQPYINYRFNVPKPFLSGNYILAVFRRANPDDILFTRKFMMVNPVSNIDQLVRMSTTIIKRDENHQIDFSVNYGDLFVNAPAQDLSIAILQNHNWITAIRNLRPTLIRANEGYMEFKNLDLSQNFPAWNDFRFADLRTLNVTGRNVAKINTSDFRIDVILGLDTDRSGKRYTQNFQDINGDYIIQNNDAGESALNTDYATVQFNLKAEQVDGNVYVTGRFNNWRLNDQNRMKYDTKRGIYFTRLLLKQGYYEYVYYLDAPDKEPYYFEGSHFLAENEYEILVYYRKPGNINDELVGYKKFRSRDPN